MDSTFGLSNEELQEGRQEAAIRELLRLISDSRRRTQPIIYCHVCGCAGDHVFAEKSGFCVRWVCAKHRTPDAE